MTTLASRRIFRNRNRPRSSIDICVGNNHLVETLFHLRRSDWNWYIENESEIEHELLELLEESIIPRMFGREIEELHRKQRPSTEKQQQQQVGSKNSKRKTKSTKKSSRKKEASALSKKDDDQEEKPEKDVYFSFGELIQLAYRRELLLSKGGYMTQHTLFYKEKEEEDEGQSVSFDYRPKLSHRLLIWISKIDPQNRTNPDPPGVGFYRPELIPISDIFREPKGASDNVDFSEDEDNKQE